jgi:hypothetical protein
MGIGSTHLSIVLDTTCSRRTLTNLQQDNIQSHDRDREMIIIGNSLFIVHKPPEVDLEVVSIHLHLLKPILAKCPEPHAFQESLEGQERKGRKQWL